MQNVSDEYRTSMKSSLRERSYIMVSFGLVNQKAQQNGIMHNTSAVTYYSNSENILKTTRTIYDYGTLEQNFTKVDGSMFFLPKVYNDQKNEKGFLDNGVISEQVGTEDGLFSPDSFKFEFDFPIDEPLDIKGLTIDFGENYPISFTITTSDSTKFEVTDNKSSVWVCDHVFSNTTSLIFEILKMSKPMQRCRIYSVKFGYGLIYYNDSVMDSSLSCYSSPIGEDLPQIDFSLKLKNYDRYFDVDNPTSAINFFETGQEMDVYYGYALPNRNTIEWVKGNHLLCSGWESDDFTATIKCQDIFRNLNSNYYKGTVENKTYYDMAIEILTAMNVSDYYVDSHLKVLTTNNPIPNVTCKEALQLIANACRAVLTQTRDGKISIKSNFTPDITFTSNDIAPWATIANLTPHTGNNVEYGVLCTNYEKVDDKDFRFMPESNSDYWKTTGYVSNSMSDDTGKFTTNPSIFVNFEAICGYYGMKIKFGNALPSGIIIHVFSEGVLRETFPVSEKSIKSTTIIKNDFIDVTQIQIEFTGTQYPKSRIVVDEIAMGDTSDFTMERKDMTSSPKAIKQKGVRDITVPYYTYKLGTTSDSLINETVVVKNGDIVTYYFSEASDSFSVTINSNTTGVSIVSSGAYHITLKYTVTGTFTLNVTGKKYTILERSVKLDIAKTTGGESIVWDNPLISNYDMAYDLAAWLAEFYKSKIEYEYNTRGNPEIDMNDIIYQENEFVKKMKVWVYRHTINFKQSLSGSITARRVGG